MKCPACMKAFNIEEQGIIIKQYVFCSSICLFEKFTLEQIKLLYKL